MQRRRSDNVFLLTLVDFLVQIIFFGLLIFVAYQALLNREAKQYNPGDVHEAIEQAGVSNLKELIDELSKLAPVRLKGFNDALGEKADAAEVKRVADAITQAGGAEGITSAMGRLAKLEQGSDKPPCLFDTVNGQRQTTVLATAVGTGTNISFTGATPELTTLLNEVGLSYGQVQSLGLREFTRIFGRVLQRHPSCRYTIVFRETTRQVDARDAAGQIFYLRIRR